MAVIEKRKARDGSVKYRVKIRLKGHRAATATFERITDAKRWAKHTEAAIEEGRYFKTAASKKRTVADLIDRYINEVIPSKPKSASQQTQQLLWWKDQLGHYILADVSPAIIANVKAKLRQSATKYGKTPSPATINRYFAVIRHAFEIAVNNWEWLDDSPFRRVIREREARGRMRFLRDDERARLLAECSRSKNSLLLPIVLLALSTGMRKGEILSLRWADIDFQRNMLTIHDSKNGERRSAPLIGSAQKALKLHSRIRRIDSDLVFPSCIQNTITPIDIKKAWYKALKDARIEDFRFHDLRHSAASYLAMSGATTAEIAAVLGHKTLSMVKRYAHITEQHSVEVLKRMNDKFL